ncbi:MAG: flagellar basal body protein, partial [Rhodobiaceae bacterium]
MARIENIFDVAGRAMSAQLVRMNTIASNLANAGNISGEEDTAYRAMKPIFETTYAANVKETGISTTEVAG